MRTALGLLLASLLLSACAAGPKPVTHLHLSDGQVSAGTSASPSVRLGPVTLPDFLLRGALMTRTGEYEVHYSNTLRWAEPLDLGIRRVVAQRLGHALGSAAVSAGPGGQGAPAQWTVSLQIREFSSRGGSILLSGEAELRHAADDAGERMLVPFTHRAEAGADTGAAIAAGMSRLLWRLAEDIATAISAPALPAPAAASQAGERRDNHPV